MHRLSLHRHCSPLKNHQIRDAFKTYGSNLHSSQGSGSKQDEGVVEKLRNQINALPLSAIHEMLSTDSEITEQTPHSLVTSMLFLTDGEYYICDPFSRSISCPVVWVALVNRLSEFTMQCTGQWTLSPRYCLATSRIYKVYTHVCCILTSVAGPNNRDSTGLKLRGA